MGRIAESRGSLRLTTNETTNQKNTKTGGPVPFVPPFFVVKTSEFPSKSRHLETS